MLDNQSQPQSAQSIPLAPQANQGTMSYGYSMDGLMPARTATWTAPPQPQTPSVPLKEGVDVLPPTPAMSDALETAYAQNPAMPRGMLESTAMQESSMGTNKANYNPSIGQYAYVFGLTPVAVKELSMKVIPTNLNTLGGAARAAAAYLSLSRVSTGTTPRGTSRGTTARRPCRSTPTSSPAWSNTMRGWAAAAGYYPHPDSPCRPGSDIINTCSKSP
jgi:hypothetical protein